PPLFRSAEIDPVALAPHCATLQGETASTLDLSAHSAFSAARRPDPPLTARPECYSFNTSVVQSVDEVLRLPEGLNGGQDLRHEPVPPGETSARDEHDVLRLHLELRC